MLVTSLKNTFKKNEASAAHSTTTETAASTTAGGRVAKQTKPIKVLKCTKNMSLDTFTKQLTTWTEINNEIPEYVKYHEFLESLKTDKDIKGLPRYIGEYVLPILEAKEDQTIKKALDILNRKYGQLRTERIEKCVDDIIKFREDLYEEDNKLMLAMKEIRQRE